jgi:hypothetical protein
MIVLNGSSLHKLRAGNWGGVSTGFSQRFAEMTMGEAIIDTITTKQASVNYFSSFVR